MEKKGNKVQNEKCTLSSAIASAFKNSLEEFHKTKHDLETDDVVLAKMTGYAPWPAKIASFSKDKRRANCYFYGSHNSGPVGVKQMIPFKDGFSTIRLVKKRNLRFFQKGIREVEIELGIPENISSLRELASIQ